MRRYTRRSVTALLGFALLGPTACSAGSGRQTGTTPGGKASEGPAAKTVLKLAFNQHRGAPAVHRPRRHG